MPGTSFIHEISNPLAPTYPFDPTPMPPVPDSLLELSPPTSHNSHLRREYGPPPRKGMTASPSFMADRIAMKRGESEGHLPGAEYDYTPRTEKGNDAGKHMRAASTEVLSRGTLGRKGTLRIRESLAKRGDSLASLFRSSKTNSASTLDTTPDGTSLSNSSHNMNHNNSSSISRQNSTASADSLHVTSSHQQVGNTVHQQHHSSEGGHMQRKQSVDSTHGSGSTGRSWGSTLMRKARGQGGDATVAPQPVAPSPQPQKKRDLDSTLCSMDDLNQFMSQTSLASLYVPKTLQLFLTHGNVKLHVKVLSHGTVADAIQGILADLVVASGGEMHVEGERGAYRLCKLERGGTGIRVWMEMGSVLGSYDFMQGDEIRLKHISDIEHTTVIVPPSTTPHPFSYGFTLLVRDAVASLRATHLPASLSTTAPVDAKYGLYYPRLGIWLDDARTLFSYDLHPEKSLELRALANQFLMRIYLPEFDQKIALRVLPSLRSSDVISMIHYQLRNRKLVLGRPNGRYGLWIPSAGTWMKENIALEEYVAVNGEDIHYKLQYESISIHLALAATPSAFTPPPLRILASSTTLVSALLATASLSNPAAYHDTYCLFSPAGDRLNDRDLVWAAIKDLAADDQLVYRAVPKKCLLSNTGDRDVRLDLDVDFETRVDQALPFMCRRFGVGVDQVLGIKTDLGVDVDTSLSLAEQRFAPGLKLILQLRPPPLSPSTLSPSTTSPTDASPSSAQTIDVNIWSEPEDDNLQYTRTTPPTVASGTLNKLIERLTDERGEGTSAYLDYVRTFLLTYRSFTTPSKVLAKLEERYHAPRSRKDTWPAYDHFRLTIQLRVCNVLLQWVKRHPSDFLGDGSGAWEDVRRFVEGVLAQDQPSLARQIRRNLVKMKDNTHPALAKHLILKSTGRPSELDPRKLSVFRYPVEEVAQQLTLIEHAFLADILPAELLNQAWSKPDAQTRAPNVNALTRRFNAVACWTAKSVLEMKTPRARAKRVVELIDIASQLLVLNNFSTLMAVIAGLNKAAISRLKLTFKEVGSKNLKKLNDMERLMTAEGSYRNYRAHLKTVSRPAIPYIGKKRVYLIDLTYMEDGNPDHIGHRINFTKRQMVSGVINEMASYQQVAYAGVKPVDELWNICARLPAATDEYEKVLWAESKKKE
ncbi:hypothetical protein HKX48_003567 [Thoreauomyces humboldtii]|nr:hypothetical protein HKX48_003567 [Thoreauomyces humboldtii]